MPYSDFSCINSAIKKENSRLTKMRNIINPFVQNALFLYPLKRFSVFRGVQKGCIGKKWVKVSLKAKLIHFFIEIFTEVSQSLFRWRFLDSHSDFTRSSIVVSCGGNKSLILLSSNPQKSKSPPIPKKE